MTASVTCAVDRALGLAHSPWTPVPPAGSLPRRAVLIGDPQTSLTKFMEVMVAHGLLGENGVLDADIALVSVGDHFDYGIGDVRGPSVEGLALLRWLAQHPPDRVILLAGNHDLARVTELARMSDDGFAALRTIARAAMDGDAAAAQRFASEAPDIPTPEVAWRDYGSFSVAQRTLVQSLLVGRRMLLAKAVAARMGTPLLVTHAGITQRELDLLGLATVPSPRVLETMLNARLHEAVETVAPRWARGELAKLPLEPWHVVGASGREGGGMLYHRPALRTDAADARFDGAAPRRFEPGSLPRGLVQAVGHSGHHRNRRELAAIATPEALARERGGLRTLQTKAAGAVYGMGEIEALEGEATLYLVDGEMHHVPVGEVPLLELDPAALATDGA